jgi:ubiquinone/menaquinone biosynthesis C-methylase UbiE
MKNKLSNKTNLTQKRYQRISGLYDLMEILPEKMYHKWRKLLWAEIQGSKVLEVGVGTGKNIPYYPPGLDITAIDLTPGMLDFAEKKAAELDVPVLLKLGDAEKLDFTDASFDTVVGTFVFCSIPDAVSGLKEIRRVLKPGGKLLLVEHVRSENKILGKIMDFLNPLVKRMMGPNINRRTAENVRHAGFSKVEVANLHRSGIFKMIAAEK